MSTIATALDRFGSVREAAVAIGRPPSVIQYWKKVGRIPAAWQQAVLDAAATRNLPITPSDLIASRSVVCSASSCDLRVDAPQVRSCTRTDCPLALKDAA